VVGCRAGRLVGWRGGLKVEVASPVGEKLFSLFFSCSFPFLIFKFSNLLSNLVLNFKFN
jgi:hypothetical protein